MHMYFNNFTYFTNNKNQSKYFKIKNQEELTEIVHMQVTHLNIRVCHNKIIELLVFHFVILRF
jgi:hypothetical protein